MSENTSKSKKGRLFAQLSGSLTLANSHRLPAEQKAAIMQAPEGYDKALAIEVCDGHKLRSAVEGALAESGASEEVQEAVRQAVADTTQVVQGRLRVSSGKGNLTCTVVSSDGFTIKPTLMESKEAKSTGTGDDESALLESLLGDAQ